MPEAQSLLKINAARNPALWGALLASAVLLHCGPGGIQVAGGTSEVGNPSSAILLDEDGEVGEEADTEYTDVGVQFDFTGVPIQIIKERNPVKQSATNDSASASESHTPSPAN